mmetsp:Transcript_29692/g.90301  ORF Transcript_29692/g.90301 Transcript_29692/m.90301 type:complete len:318 (+) Transcript_29692:433-1386(+)
MGPTAERVGRTCLAHHRRRLNTMNTMRSRASHRIDIELMGLSAADRIAIPNRHRVEPDGRRSPNRHRVEDRLLRGGALLLGRLAAREDLPEAERLVGRGGDDGGAVGRLRHVEHARGVPRQLGHLDHRRVLPQDELVVRVAVRRDELAVVLRPLKRANLRVRVDRVEARARRRVPEANHPVGGASARGEQVPLPRAPREGLDGGAVLVESQQRLVAHSVGGGGVPVVPHVEDVVVAARGELRARGGPLEPADLLRVAAQRADLVVRHANVVLHHHRVSAARGEEGPVPGEGGDARAVAVHRPNLLQPLHVPDLDGVV